MTSTDIQGKYLSLHLFNQAFQNICWCNTYDSKMGKAMHLLLAAEGDTIYFPFDSGEYTRVQLKYHSERRYYETVE